MKGRNSDVQGPVRATWNGYVQGIFLCTLMNGIVDDTKYRRVDTWQEN